MIGRKREMAISEAELSSMTSELDMLHKETFPGVHKSLDEFSANLAHLSSGRSTGRRSFLMGLGGVVAIGTVAACSSSAAKPKAGSSAPVASTPAGTSASPSASSTASPYTGDLKVVALAAALENLAVAAYGGAIAMAGKGTFGTVPPAFATFATTAMAQHKDHAAAWNAVLQKASLPAITGTPLTIAAGEVSKLQASTSIVAVAELALNLENVAAATYTFATANVSDIGGVMTAATIQPVETMHAAILNFVLGQYPVPVSFISDSTSLMPAMLTA